MVLALRVHEQKLRARRVEVLADTTLCKGQSVGQFGIAPEHIVEKRLCQIEVLRCFVRRLNVFVRAAKLANVCAWSVP